MRLKMPFQSRILEDRVAEKPSGRLLAFATALAVIAACGKSKNNSDAGTVDDAGPEAADSSHLDLGMDTAEADVELDEVSADQDFTALTSCEPGASLAWEPCGPAGAFDCATLVVPISHDAPSGPTYELPVMRRPATDPARRDGVVFIHPGGVAKPSLDMFAPLFFVSAPSVSADLADTRDLVALDSRGSTEPLAVMCDSFAAARGALDLSPDDEVEWAAHGEYWQEFLATCTPADIETLRTFDARSYASDLDCLVNAMGEEQLDFIGASTGTLVGAAFAAKFPNRVRRMVLDAALEPSATLLDHLELRGRAMEERFMEIVSACGADATCPFHGGEGEANVLAAYDALVASLDQGATVGNDEVTDSDVAMLVAAETTRATAGDRLWPALAAAEAGDYSLLLQEGAPPWGAPAGRFWALAPNDLPCPADLTMDAVRARMQDVAAVAPRIAPAIVMPAAGLCLHWPHRGSPLNVSTTAPATLLIAGETDVLAPAEGAQALQTALGNGSTLFRHTESGHVAIFTKACVRDAALAFLLNGTIPEVTCP